LARRKTGEDEEEPVINLAPRENVPTASDGFLQSNPPDVGEHALLRTGPHRLATSSVSQNLPYGRLAGGR